ncbi:MAG TPA: DUF3445 domain-containing protein [Acidimicrobiales bacterium]
MAEGAGTADWLDEIEPATEPPFVRMATRGLRGRPWLLGGDDVPAQLAEKRRVLAEHPDDVVVAQPGHDAAIEELAALVAAEGIEGSGAAAGFPVVAEDLCLVVDGVLVAGIVCFPSHWRLRDKIGRPMAEVHAPVPDYDRDLRARVDRFLARLRPGLRHGVVRRNWTVHHRPDLYASDVPPPPDPPVTPDDAAERLWFRSERQTLVRLPRTGAVVFTIRTQQVPLGALADRPGLCRTLHDAVAAWPPHQVDYRGGEALRTALRGWLAAPRPPRRR